MLKSAFAIRIHQYGDQEQLSYEAIEVPAPALGEVQILQHAVGVNYLDTYNRRGVFPVPALPWGLGVEGAGVIIAVGDGVFDFKVGDRVTYASRPIGSYASLRNLPTKLLLHLPDSISFRVAAAATLQGLTAHMLLHKVAPLSPGQTVLIHAAAGGLGSILTQWSRLMGARVIGTVGSEAKAQLALSRGCHEVILYNQDSFTKQVKRLTNGVGVDVVFEGLGGSVFYESLTILKPFGHLVNLGQVVQGLPSVALSDIGPVRSLTVSVPGVFAYMNTHPNLQSAADTLFKLISSGDLIIHIGCSYALKDTQLAHQALESRSTTGSLILLPDTEGITQ